MYVYSNRFWGSNLAYLILKLVGDVQSKHVMDLLVQSQARKLVPPPVALLVLANKSDLPAASSPEQVAQALGLFTLDAELCKW